ncbi:MAG: SIS domain-containing protein [Spirochaetia bacterium]
MELNSGAREAIDHMLSRHTALEPCRRDIEAAIGLVVAVYDAGHKVLTVGNGGSSADADHIVGELMKSFALPRPLSADVTARLAAAPIDDEIRKRLTDGLEQPLPAINLTSHTALTSAFSNDADPGLVYAQSLLGFGAEGDVLIGLSTSGNSQNIVAAAALARSIGVSVISLTGSRGGRLAELADVAIRVPSDTTADVQEYHLPIYHCLCAAVEAQFFG